MRHDGFRDMVLLAKSGVPWNIAMGWSGARRAAALAILFDKDERA